MIQQPKNIIIAVVVVAMLGFLFAIRHQFSQPIEAEKTEEVTQQKKTEKSSRSGSTSITVFDDYDPEVAPPRQTPHIRTVANKDWVENYDTQLLRAAGDAHIIGVVADEDDNPVAGAEIMLYESDPMTTHPALRTAVTDEEGSYTLTDLNERGVAFILAARAKGFAPEVRFIMMNGPQRQDITLAEGVALSGTVLDAQTSAPVVGATVYFPANRWTVFSFLGTATSDGMGRFRFQDVKPGQNMTVAEATGYARTSKSVRSPADDAVIAMRKGGGIIRGMTVTRLGEKPAGGARVVLYSRNGGVFSTSSKPDGTIELRDLPGGRHTLLAFKGAPSKPERVELEENEVKENVKLILPSEVYVNGRVVRADNSKPLPGVAIKHQGILGVNTVLSDEDGRFAFTTLAIDSYWVEVHERGLLPLQDKDNESTSVQERFVKQIDAGASSDDLLLKLRRVPAITGVVRQARGKGEGAKAAPVWNADVYAHVEIDGELRNLFTRSDSNGTFFVNLPDNKRGYARVFARRGRAVAMGETRAPMRQPLRLNLEEKGLKGEVYLSDKTPLSGVTISAIYQFTAPAQYDRLKTLRGDTTRTNLYGGFQLPLVSGNRVTLQFRLPDGIRIEKDYATNALSRNSQVFVYDPVSKEIMSDAKGGSASRRTEGGRRDGGRGGQRPGGPPRQR